MNKYIKKEIKLSGLFVVAGIALGILGYFQEGMNQKTLYGLCLAFSAIGAVQIIIYLLVRNKPQYIDNIKAEKEERSVFIRGKSGNFAFWVTFPAISIANNLDYFSKMTVSDFSMVILIFMSIVYFSSLFYNLKKY